MPPTTVAADCASDLPVRLRHGVTLERATAHDVPAVVRLLADDQLGAGRESDPGQPCYQRAFEEIEADAHQMLVVARVEDDGARVGFYERLGFVASHVGMKLDLTQ